MSDSSQADLESLRLPVLSLLFHIVPNFPETKLTWFEIDYMSLDGES